MKILGLLFNNIFVYVLGELILNVPPDGINNPNVSDIAPGNDTAGTYAPSEGPIAMPSYDVEFQRAVERAAQGREVETIKLFKPENSSLGFSVVGMKKKDNAESGIFIQDIQPGGIAARYFTKCCMVGCVFFIWSLYLCLNDIFFTLLFTLS